MQLYKFTSNRINGGCRNHLESRINSNNLVAILHIFAQYSVRRQKKWHPGLRFIFRFYLQRNTAGRQNRLNEHKRVGVIFKYYSDCNIVIYVSKYAVSHGLMHNYIRPAMLMHVYTNTNISFVLIFLIFVVLYLSFIPHQINCVHFLTHITTYCWLKFSTAERFMLSVLFQCRMSTFEEITLGLLHQVQT